MVHSQWTEKVIPFRISCLFFSEVREFHFGYVFSHVLCLVDLAFRYYVGHNCNVSEMIIVSDFMVGGIFICLSFFVQINLNWHE